MGKRLIEMGSLDREIGIVVDDGTTVRYQRRYCLSPLLVKDEHFSVSTTEFKREEEEKSLL